MMSTSNNFTTDFRGSNGGVRFDDTPASEVLSGSFISKIIIQHLTYIYSFEIYYSWDNGKGTAHGYDKGDRVELVLDRGEFITKIEGRWDSSCIVGLTFVTNKRTCGPFGGTTGKTFEWAPVSTDTPMRLLAFLGTADSRLHGLQAIFCESDHYLSHRENLPKTILYESLSDLVTLSQTTVSPGVSKSFSGFTFHLMNPVITLSVGEDRVQFRAHQDTLCQLPFFKAALLGGFKEASEQAINMPEDDPSHISALIEFMYTGNYTYTYDPDCVKLYDESTNPIGDLAEGLFHASIHIMASKYDCPKLVELSTIHFEIVLGELDDINAFRLWKTAYTDGISFPGLTKGLKQYRSREGLISWVKALYSEHREEMEKTVTEFPMLSSDLLRITTGDSY